MTYTWTEVETWMKNNELSASKLSQMLTGRSGATTVFAWRRTKRIGGKYAIKLERLMNATTPVQRAAALYTPGQSLIVTARKPKPRMTIHHDSYNFCPYCGHKL